MPALWIVPFELSALSATGGKNRNGRISEVTSQWSAERNNVRDYAERDREERSVLYKVRLKVPHWQVHISILQAPDVPFSATGHFATKFRIRTSGPHTKVLPPGRLFIRLLGLYDS
ncbi:predicted protein [Histoplasma capsulatum G186AR]|uniref:Uncharacterized protein n=1 Tax=Ajellomyces capsulatus (strain G186AR / H82 / ATCC MYA-2454 / RMSCC 2432) TaxID=447093 RepID=C0NNA0_AJECG|nr:uncharacterized protein HCBG_04227 [Histoplasma capsulatum G186AR]EEH07348.1 predicted protein [Histoplasma capsulatum G186AR]